jgi:hypothetical protein
MKYVSISILISSFLVGIIYIYLSKPELKIVKISPTPDNSDEFLYKDKAGNCHKYEPIEVECDTKLSFFSIQN